MRRALTLALLAVPFGSGVAEAAQVAARDRLTAALVLGVLVATVVILTFLWRAVRDPALAYLIGLDGLLAFYVTASGELLPAAVPPTATQVAVALLFACGLAFAVRYFELDRLAPRLGRFTQGLAIGWVAVAPLALFGLTAYARLLQGATLLTVALFLGIGIYARLNRLTGATIFLAAWALIGLAGAARAPAWGGLFGMSDLGYTLAPVHLGAAVAAILMALAGANRVRAQREANEAALRQSRERFALAARGANDGLYDWDVPQRTAWFSGRLHDLLGLADGQLTEAPTSFFDLVVEADRAMVGAEIRRSFTRRRRKYAIEFRMRHADGQPRWMEAAGMVLYQERHPLRVVGSLRDVTDRKLAQDAVKESEGRYALAVRGSSEGIYDWDLRTHSIYFSDRHAEIAGLTREAMGSERDSFLRHCHPDDRHKLTDAVRQLVKQRDRSNMGVEYRIRRADGAERWVYTNGAVQVGADGRAIRIAGSTSDITERKQAQEKLLHDLLHDQLTDLGNRALFTERVTAALADPQARFAVVLINLDRFRQVNDDLGHPAGDQLLVAMAARLSGFVGPADTAARFGGDEFALLLHGIDEEHAAEAMAARLQAVAQAPMEIGGQKLFPSVSIGVTLGPTGERRAEDLIADATLAMYRAKGGGRGRWWLFRAGTRTRAPGRVALETDLHHAIERGELVLHYQPIVDLDELRLAGFEALLRWRHPSRGMVPPVRFIPMAEETGMIVPIGRWALSQAARGIARWRRLAPDAPPGFVSVNVSARQFLNHDVVADVRDVLRETGIDPAWLKLEVTESLIMSNPTLAQDALQGLRRLGVLLSVDDFGTGYSSLSYLHRFPFQTLKIDRSFVTTMHAGQENLVIVKAIADLAHSLGMQVVAEGVETPQEVAALRELACEYGQGYFFSQALDDAGADALAAAGAHWTLSARAAASGG